MRNSHICKARRGAAVLAAGTALVMVTAGTASAHECFVASRSTQGNLAAGTHSQAWDMVSLDTVLTQFIGLPQSLADCVEANADQYGIPSYFVLGGKQAVGSDGVIAANNPNMTAGGLADNGTGIDHAEDVYGPAIGAAIGACSG